MMSLMSMAGVRMAGKLTTPVNVAMKSAPKMNLASQFHTSNRGLMSFLRNSNMSSKRIAAQVKNAFQPLKRGYRVRNTYAEAEPMIGRSDLSSTAKAGWTLAGAAALVGLGTVYYAGTSATSDASMVNDAYLPQYARDRIKKTYGYVAGGLGLTAATATVLFKTGVAHRVLAINPLVFGIGSLIATIGSMVAARSIDAETNPVGKHLAWGVFNTSMALSLSSIGFFGGPIVLKAAAATGALVGSLSILGMSAPSESFLWMQGPLVVGLGVVFAGSIGQMFFPASSALHNVVLYGGLALFGGFTLYDTQKMIHVARNAPARLYDPMNQSFGIYLNTINIFVRMVQIFSGSGRRK